MIDKLVAVCESFDKRLNAIENSLTKIAEATSELRNVLAEPSGFITTNAVVQEGMADLRNTLKHPVQLGLEEAKVTVQFAQAFYLTSSPNLKDKLHEFLSENELVTLLRTVETYRKAEGILGLAEKRAADAETQYQQAKKNIEGAIERHAAHTFSRVVDRMHQQLSDLSVKKDFVAQATEKLETALSKCQAFMAKHSNDLKANTRISNSRIYSP